MTVISLEMYQKRNLGQNNTIKADIYSNINQKWMKLDSK